MVRVNRKNSTTIKVEIDNAYTTRDMYGRSCSEGIQTVDNTAWLNSLRIPKARIRSRVWNLHLNTRPRFITESVANGEPRAVHTTYFKLSQHTSTFMFAIYRPIKTYVRQVRPCWHWDPGVSLFGLIYYVRHLEYFSTEGTPAMLLVLGN